jgi:hypothetical protein
MVAIRRVKQMRSMTRRLRKITGRGIAKELRMMAEKLRRMAVGTHAPTIPLFNRNRPVT